MNNFGQTPESTDGINADECRKNSHSYAENWVEGENAKKILKDLEKSPTMVLTPCKSAKSSPIIPSSEEGCSSTKVACSDLDPNNRNIESSDNDPQKYSQLNAWDALATEDADEAAGQPLFYADAAESQLEFAEYSDAVPVGSPVVIPVGPGSPMLVRSNISGSPQLANGSAFAQGYYGAWSPFSDANCYNRNGNGITPVEPVRERCNSDDLWMQK